VLQQIKSFKNRFFPICCKQKSNHFYPVAPFLKQLATDGQETYSIFTHTPLFFHRDIHSIPAILFHKEFGIILFEIKDWNLKYLNNATLKKHQTYPDNNTLAFHHYIDLLEKKYTQITHKTLPSIQKIALFTNLTQEEYQQLSTEKKQLLPKQKIVFKETTKEEFFSNLTKQKTPLNIEDILPHIFTQYSFFTYDNKLAFANAEQRKFLDTPLEKVTNLTGAFQSGISATLLLKALIEVIVNKRQKVIILKATSLAKEILLEKLLLHIEHAIISLEFDTIEVLTPYELLESTSKYKKIDILLCDDATLIENHLLQKIEKTYKKSTLVFGNHPNKPSTFHLTRNYNNQNLQLFTYTEHIDIKVLHIITKLIEDVGAYNILVVASFARCEKLFDDLQHYIKEDISKIDTTTQLKDISQESLRLVEYNNALDLHAQTLILLDVEEAKKEELDSILASTHKSVHLFFEKQSKNSNYIKERYESDQNAKRV
jgi:hypothetical protein